MISSLSATKTTSLHSSRQAPLFLQGFKSEENFSSEEHLDVGYGDHWLRVDYR
ncbi:hypothetical protein XENOCAPTIV_009806, partial [Xenoophorus captivus]